MTFVLAVAFALLTLPFVPFWPDFEVARRGVLLLAVAFAAALLPRWLARPLPRGTLWFVALAAWYGIRCIDVTNPPEALLRTAHVAALVLCFVLGASARPERVLAAIVPATVVLSAFGIAQAFGLAWPFGYTRAAEPIATLGNRNVASEVACVGTAAALALVARRRRQAWPTAALVAGAAYLVVNGSRSGLVGTALACAAILADRGARRRRALFTLAAGLTLGLAIDLGQNRAPAPPPDEPAIVGSPEPAPATVAVRLALWRGSLAMAAAAPLVGHGSGQFRYAYPRHRTAEEIELSSFGRAFPTFADTAHNDYLEVSIEGGIVGAILWLVVVVLALGPRLRSRAEPALLAPGLAFAVLAAVRSPVGIAPAAAAVFVLLGSLAGTGPAVRLGRLGWFLAVALAAAFAWLGFGPLVAQTAAASWVRATVVDPDGAAATPAERLAMLDRAVRWHPSESRFRTLRIGARIAALPHGLHPTTDAEKQALAAVFAASAEDMTTIARLDPDNTNALFTIAELAHAAGNRQAARAALTRILQLDPRDPRATLLLAVLLCESGEVPAGIAVLRADPHPRLREGLARHLQELADAPSLRDDADGAALLRHEARFVRALDQVEQRPGAPLADAAVQAYASRAGTGDVRARILLARQLAARGDTEAAAALSARFHEPGERIELSFADRRLLAAVLDELRRVPAWRTALDR